MRKTGTICNPGFLEPRIFLGYPIAKNGVNVLIIMVTFLPCLSKVTWTMFIGFSCHFYFLKNVPYCPPNTPSPHFYRNRFVTSPATLFQPLSIRILKKLFCENFFSHFFFVKQKFFIVFFGLLNKRKLWFHENRLVR